MGIATTCRLAGRYLIEVVPRKGLEPLRHFRGSGFKSQNQDLTALPLGLYRQPITVFEGLGGDKNDVYQLPYAQSSHSQQH